MRMLLLLALLLGCSRDASPASVTPVTPEAPSSDGATYDLHEWGLVSTGPNGFELAAGPGQRAIALTVDKPVLYVHAQQAMDLRVVVTPGAGMSVAEHWPLTGVAPLSWQVRVQPGACPTPRTYPSSCNAPDGYCETAELALYETDDAACLTHGDHALPLLFYRMRADVPPTMPLTVRRSGADVIVHNTSWRDGVGSVWRVSWDGQTGVTRASRVDVPAVGADVTLGAPTSDVNTGRRALRADLATHGLTAPETEAFMRAWDTALFGPSADGDPGDRGTDSPVQVDEDAVDELTADGVPMIVGGPRIADTILYWLPADAIEELARIEATPAPNALRRAILVRADAR